MGQENHLGQHSLACENIYVCTASPLPALTSLDMERQVETFERPRCRAETEQAAATIKHACQEPLNVIAASMGGYSAIKLTEHFVVKNLILLVPAVYSSQAYETPFGSEFSAIIREPNSWINSDAFETLSGFDGSVTIIAAEADEVIPMNLIEQLYASARNAEKKDPPHCSQLKSPVAFPTGEGFS